MGLFLFLLVAFLMLGAQKSIAAYRRHHPPPTYLGGWTDARR